jgi:hypothetical protein
MTGGVAGIDERRGGGDPALFISGGQRERSRVGTVFHINEINDLTDSNSWKFNEWGPVNAARDGLGRYGQLAFGTRFKDVSMKWKGGAAEETRTPDPIITNDVLYQLSYSGLPGVLIAPRLPGV